MEVENLNIYSSVTYNSLWRPEELRDRHADLVTLDDDLAAGDRLVVGHDQHRVILPGIEFDDRAAAHAQELMHGNDRPAEHDGEFDLDGFDVGSHVPCPETIGSTLPVHAFEKVK